MRGREKLERLRVLVEQGEEAAFYSWTEWHAVRAEVLKLDHYECQMCRARGRYRKGRIVHHVQHLKDRPDLALSIWDPDSGERQLITVCKDCHEDLHPESLRQFAPQKASVTVERWD